MMTMNGNNIDYDSVMEFDEFQDENGAGAPTLAGELAGSDVAFNSPSEIAPFVYTLYKKRVPRKKTDRIVKGATLNFDTTNLDTEAIISLVVQQVYSGEAYKGEEKDIPITNKEMEYITAFAQEHPSPLPKKQDAIKNLLISYLANSRYDDHQSGWVYYNTKRVFIEAGLQKLSPQDKNGLVNILVANGAVKLKVVGKKNPKLCYKLEWREDGFKDEDIAGIVRKTPDYSSKSFLEQIKRFL